MGIFSFKKPKKSSVRQSYWGSKSKVPVSFQRNDDTRLGDEERDYGPKTKKEVKKLIKDYKAAGQGKTARRLQEMTGEYD